MNRDITILGAPSNLGLMPSGSSQEPGVGHAPRALREYGIVERIRAVDLGDVAAPPYRPRIESRTGIRNSEALRTYMVQLAQAIQPLLTGGQFPLVIGGDCSILLGSMLAARRTGNFGLVFIDGHRDFQTPESSATGGAAGMDLALATGYGPAELIRVDEFSSLVREEAVVVVGHRDVPQIGADPSGTIAETAITLYDLETVRQTGPHWIAEQVRATMEASGVRGYWIHLDVDVLSTQVMPAVDSPQPGGMGYEELGNLLVALLQNELAAGMEITIYDPERDPGGWYGRRLTEWLEAIFGETPMP